MFSSNKPQDPDLEFFAVHDSKTNSYKQPFPAPNSAVCIREFQNAFKAPNAIEVNEFYRNPEDYKLYKVGAFYLKTGKLVAQEPEHVISFHDLHAAVNLKTSPRALSST